MGLAETIKKAAIDAVEASNPVRVLFGEVLAENPLEIKVDQRFILTQEFLVITDTAEPKLTAGTKVILLRVQGGQQYVVLDKLVST